MLSNGLSYVGSLGTTVLNPGASAWTLTATSQLTLTVVDLCFDTEQFQVFDFGVSLGVTSNPGNSFPNGCQAPTPFTDDPLFTLNSATFSRGVFTLQPGAHSLTILNLGANATSAAFRVLDLEEAIPEPSTAVLLMGGLSLLLVVRKRRVA